MKKKADIKYSGFIAEIKQRIIQSRYQAARVANRELLLLYLYVGKRISEKIQAEKWGTKVLQQLSNDLQAELPGLRGFSESSLKKMRQFSDEYLKVSIRPLPTVQLGVFSKKKTRKKLRPSATVQLENVIGQSLIAQLKKAGKAHISGEAWLNSFFGISFSHHILLLNRCGNLKERTFYIQMASENMWSVSVVEHQITANLYKHQGLLPNNFKTTLPDNMHSTALHAFKDEYLFDFMSLDDTVDERAFEDASVANIRKFIMSLGKGFSFIGNQYKVEVGGNEFFIDLLFYNRILQCLVVFELKRGKFKPEYAGKLNFYLNVLDDKVKLQHEKPSIGIILCKEKNNTEVEYSFKSINKAMGVATYKLSTEIPKEMRGILPSPEKLKRLI